MQKLDGDAKHKNVLLADSPGRPSKLKVGVIETLLVFLHL